MARKSTSDPEWFATPEGRRQTLREFEKALKEGTVLREEGSQIPRSDAAMLSVLMEQAKARASRVISLRVPVTDLELAQKIADKKGVGLQTILKRAIREGLKKHA
jgi:predicted DNA binding CopG/RHH family protein